MVWCELYVIWFEIERSKFYILVNSLLSDFNFFLWVGFFVWVDERVESLFVEIIVGIVNGIEYSFVIIFICVYVFEVCLCCV